MRRPWRATVGFAALAVLAGCATNQSKYSWGKYDQALYDYYKRPAEAANYMAALRKAIDDAGRSRQPVAPGICAEYGYMLMQQQNYDEAVRYFEQEKQAWPESSQFMDQMIRTARLGGKPAEQGGETS